jgi:hypothetical protein
MFASPFKSARHPRLQYLLFSITLSFTPILSIAQKQHVIHIVFTSDAHYGITRAKFRGDTVVPSQTVNEAMIAEMNRLPQTSAPNDNGVDAGKKINAVDYLIQTGDIANRMEVPIQSAATSWYQFEGDYLHRVRLIGHNGKPATVLIAPGNHDISDAIGHYKIMRPLTDPTSMVSIYNLMLRPATPMTNDRYDYRHDKINYSRDIGGIHFMFITLWPDSAERIWMATNLVNVSPQTPVVIFTHDQPECEAKHFINPAQQHAMNAETKFENLTGEIYKDGKTSAGNITTIEQRGWVSFLKQHPNIKAYFHGNSNFNQFYVYRGPDNDVALNTFRVDSPMKGDISSKDETKLSFQLISLDTSNKTLTVRECFWNKDPQNKDQPLTFGESKTIRL